MTRRTSFLRLTWWIESITTLNATVLLDLLYPVTTSTGFGPDKDAPVSCLFGASRQKPYMKSHVGRLSSRDRERRWDPAKRKRATSLILPFHLISLPNRTPPIPSRFRCPSCSLDFFQLQMILSLRLLVSLGY